MNTFENFFKKPLFLDKRFITAIWFLVALIAGLKHSIRGVFNDYIIFKSVFYHTIEQVNLYLEYPELNGDSNHYGPLFSLIFAPFALLPDNIGTILWDLAMPATLFWAIYKLPVVWNSKAIIFYISLLTLYGSAVNSETNTMVAALIIGTFICIRSGKDFWAACFIALGVFVKLYGIVGLAFFFFSKHKPRLILYLIVWSIIFFVLPMLISSPSFIIQSYADWYDSLIIKNSLNVSSINQDISVMGMIRRLSGYYDLSNIPILIGGVLLFAAQYLKFKYYKDLNYQLSILASALLFVVLFSTGSEASTYIIATTGAAIWFILQQQNSKTAVYLVIFMLAITLLSTGVSPVFIRKDIIRTYALQALPFFMIWLTLVYQIITYKGVKATSLTEEESPSNNQQIQYNSICTSNEKYL